jgi:hypothetical protein
MPASLKIYVGLPIFSKQFPELRYIKICYLVLKFEICYYSNPSNQRILQKKKKVYYYYYYYYYY